jgi:hypothetical protein
MPIPQEALDAMSLGALNVDMTVRGLTVNEAKVVLAALPADTTSTVAVVQPAVGGKRYAIATEALSSHAAKDLVTALCLSTARTADEA